MSEQRNLIVAIALSLAIFLGFDYFFGQTHNTQNPQVSTPQQITSPQTMTPALALGQILSREDALKQDERILIESPQLKGSLRLKGAVIDDISLKNYKETPDEASAPVVILSPQQSKGGYYTSCTWQSLETSTPTEDTVWKLDSAQKNENVKLTPQTPIKLYWDNGKSVRFERTISIDDMFVITIADKVLNGGSSEINIQSQSSITRMGTPQTSGYMVLHEGIVGIINNKLQEIGYSDLLKKSQIQESTLGGWAGFTDKYWLVSLIPNQKIPSTISFKTLPGENYQVQTIGQLIRLKAGDSSEYTQNLFVGAKVLRVLDDYENRLGINKFHLAVDFGWFYFLTKPLFYVLEFLHNLLGNLGFAILALTVIFKAIMFPLANKSHRSMARMKNLQPKMEKLKALYGDDKMRLNQEMMKLYQQEKANPLSGCLPMLIQAPIFFCLYKVFFVTIEMRHAPFLGWIHDLSAPDPTSVINLFGLIPWMPPSFLMIGAWPFMMGISMILQQRMGPQPADPQQAKVMMIMPLMFTYLFASFPAGLVIYWTWSNVLTIAQQWYMNYMAQASLLPSNGKKKI